MYDVATKTSKKSPSRCDDSPLSKGEGLVTAFLIKRGEPTTLPPQSLSFTKRETRPHSQPFPLTKVDTARRGRGILANGRKFKNFSLNHGLQRFNKQNF
jgi:hypothetical protein